MKPTLANPPRFALAERDGPRVTLTSDAGYGVHLFVLEDEIVRVALLSGDRFVMPRTWSIATGEEDVPEEGRDRFDTTGFSKPAYDFVDNGNSISITTRALRLTLELFGLHCRWEMKTPGGWKAVAYDRRTQAYNFGWWGGKVHHYLVRHEGERYFGLGERSGDMDRALRRFRLSGVDAMGYSAKTSDPLYKHVPFYITHDAQSSAAFGLFYDTYADCEFDFGAEISNYHGPYRTFTAESGDLDYYVIAGPHVADVVRRVTWLTGRPMLPPKWSLGYSGSTMSYTDAEDAQARMADFIDKCRLYDIPCSSFHLSSGYSSIGDKRHVFHWNREKFPDPKAFVKSYHDAGLMLVANIKPCLLVENPLFEEARANGLLISDASGEPDWTQFWNGLGAYVDFTNPTARNWWRERVASSLLAFGIDATWNDNNEFETRSPAAVAHGFGKPPRAVDCKPLQTLSMMRASRDAQRQFAPDRRPFLVTRAGAAGMQRYAQTWSGDNSTSWETLRYNIKMGLGLALSGVSNSGHDVGGFAGPAPDPELFVRWVEAGIFMPRFSIHSWNSDGTVNEPWMHENAIPLVRRLIALRYSLLPYLYDLLWRYHTTFEPVWRPTFYDFPEDPRSLEESDSYLLGPALFVTPVCEPNGTKCSIYLPGGASWADYWSGSGFQGGITVAADVPLGKPALFVRQDQSIAMNIAEQHFNSQADVRAFALFPPPHGRIVGSCWEDDGESERWRDGAFGVWKIEADCGERIVVACRREGDSRLLSKNLALRFRPCERRAIEVRSGRVVSDTCDQDWRTVVIELD